MISFLQEYAKLKLYVDLFTNLSLIFILFLKVDFKNYFRYRDLMIISQKQVNYNLM